MAAPPREQPTGLQRAGRALDHYQVLAISRHATPEEIKAAYRALVKRHHPDAGGDDQWILALNAAWEVLRDGARRHRYDRGLASAAAVAGPGVAAPGEGPLPRGASPGRGASNDEQLIGWLRRVYAPIDQLLSQILHAFPAQLRALAADPYDDGLMEAFCAFLRQSQRRMEKVQHLYRSMACPASWQGVSLALYHCFSQVQDALVELERYTLGYVDDYLRDGREMLREAGNLRRLMQEERRRLML